MDQTNWMAVIVMAIFVISICNGYRKGFFRLCVSFVATIFTVILVSILTPHVGEAIMKWTSVDEVIEKNCMEIFAPAEIAEKEDMEMAAMAISKNYGCAVLCKGGHSESDADDILYSKGNISWIGARRIDNPNTHGTGCTLSSAIASNLAKGFDLKDAVAEAKAYISGALSAMLDLGHGSGPVDHGFDLSGRFAEKK